MERVTDLTCGAFGSNNDPTLLDLSQVASGGFGFCQIGSIQTGKRCFHACFGASPRSMTC